jgi:DNA-binding NarL/FixJ family response regulator
MVIKVIIADDHKIMRDGLTRLLDDNPGIQVVAEAGDGRETVKLAGTMDPDIVVMDVAMPLLNGVEATRQIKEANPDIKIIALSMYSDKQFVTGMFSAGASGYLLKDCAGEELIEAIKAVHANHNYLSRDITSVVVREFIGRLSDPESSIREELTEREKEVLQLIAEGKSTRAIAEILSLSVKTIETHRQNIMSKLEIYSIPELTKYAIKTGLTSLDH